jgi:hypothetical protein
MRFFRWKPSRQSRQIPVNGFTTTYKNWMGPALPRYWTTAASMIFNQRHRAPGRGQRLNGSQRARATMTRTPIAPGARVLLLAISLAGCTNFSDPENRAAANGVVGAGVGALIGGLATGGGIGLPIGLGAGAALGAIAGALAPPSPPVISGPTFPW